jgi:hypothetical protein
MIKEAEVNAEEDKRQKELIESRNQGEVTLHENRRDLEEHRQSLTQEQIDKIEAAINDKFDLVSFKMFEVQINGNEKEICETIYKGVPFQDLNTAGKIQSGLDIINALSRHHETFLPIFIDNRESATWVPSVQSQIINLVVDSESETLRVVRVEESELATV